MIQPRKCDERIWKLLFIAWLINLNDNKNQYYMDKHVRNAPRDSITGWEINDNRHIHYPVAADHGLGCSWIPWAFTLQVCPSWKLQVDWICSGLAGDRWVPWVEGGRSLLNMIPHGPSWEEIDSTPAFFLPGTLSTTSHLADQSWSAVHLIPPIWAHYFRNTWSTNEMLKELAKENP